MSRGEHPRAPDPADPAPGDGARLAEAARLRERIARLERRVALERAVSPVLADAQGTIEEALPAVLSTLGEALDAFSCGFWAVEADGGLVGRLLVAPGCQGWVAGAAQSPEELPPAVGEAVLRTARRDQAITIPSHDVPASGAVAFPVAAGARHFGVILLRLPTGSEHDEERLGMLEDLGRAIGQCAARLAAQTELRETARQRAEFISLLGHELRNPLAAASSGVELLRQGEADPWTVAMVGENIEMISRRLHELLDLSRIERGQFRLRPARVDAAELVERVVAGRRRHARLERRTLRSQVEGRGLYVDADRVHLEEALGGLLANAIQFTGPDGQITVRVAGEDSEVVITVADDGAGIPLGTLAATFDERNPSGHHRPRGLGIGLSLTRQLVELHGGTVEADSEGLTQGAVITVRLPRAGMGRPRNHDGR